MKKIFLTALLVNAFAFVACTTDADEVDTFDASVVCPADGLNKYGMPNRGTFIDERDGQEYKYTTIGDQVWMAQNLNYAAERSVCQGKDLAKCDLYGRFYYALVEENYGARRRIDWDYIDTICPSGWHIPVVTEWDALTLLVKSTDSTITASRLKSVDGWENSRWGGGSDDCGFSALPGGGVFGYEDLEGKSAYFFIATAKHESAMYLEAINIAVYKEYGMRYLPVRCVKD